MDTVDAAVTDRMTECGWEVLDDSIAEFMDRED